MKLQNNKDLIRTLMATCCLLIMMSSLHAQNFTDATVDASILPVRLISFSGMKKGSDVQLTWATASETNNSHFTVQRSFNGREFSDLGSVRGTGNSVGNNYSFSDMNAPESNLYYRLQQVDFDGKSTASSIVLIKNTRSNSFELAAYPNPVASNELRLVLNLPKNKYLVELKNSAGSSVYSQQFDYTGGKGNIQLNFPIHPANGVYILQLTGDDIKLQQAILFQQ